MRTGRAPACRRGVAVFSRPVIIGSPEGKKVLDGSRPRRGRGVASTSVVDAWEPGWAPSVVGVVVHMCAGGVRVERMLCTCGEPPRLGWFARVVGDVIVLVVLDRGGGAVVVVVEARF